MFHNRAATGLAIFFSTVVFAPIGAQAKSKSAPAAAASRVTNPAVRQPVVSPQVQREAEALRQRLIRQGVPQADVDKTVRAYYSGMAVNTNAVPAFSSSFQSVGGASKPVQPSTAVRIGSGAAQQSTGSGNQSNVAGGSQMPGQIPAATAGRLQFAPVSPNPTPLASENQKKAQQNNLTAGGALTITRSGNPSLTQESGQPPKPKAITTPPKAPGTLPIAPYTSAYLTKMADTTNAAIRNTPPFKDGKGECTDYAAAVYNKIADRPIPNNYKNADQWYSMARKNNLATLPATTDAIRVVPPGSVVVWGGSGDGHVAIVTKNDGKTITISEMNWGAHGEKFNTVEERQFSYNKIGLREGSTATGTYRYELQGFILPSN